MSRNILPLSLPPEYRCLPIEDHYGCPNGFALMYQEPAMNRWHTLSIRDTVEQIKADYERICDGEQP